METIWFEVKDKIRNHIPAHSYRMWIEPIEFVEAHDTDLVLSCPNPFSKKRVLDHYGSLIEAHMAQASGTTLRLRIEVAAAGSVKKTNEDNDRQLSLPKVNVVSHSGRFLRRDFTFDQFVVGENSDFAYSAALSLASRRNCQQNSLYLFSQTGMGKSHLSQAIGHHIISKYPSDRVYYITAEDFTNEMVHALRNDSIGGFKEKYRNNCDVLLLEDVHFLTGKDRTQVELALTLDTLYDSGRKIIFSSCYLPSDIPKLNDKLRSRMSCGLISNIDPPDFKTRVRILKKKSQMNGYSIPEEVTQYLAGELTENVRQLESGLIGVAAKSSLLAKPIDRYLAESVIKNITQKSQAITLDVIKKLVCKHYNLTVGELVSRSRKQSIVRPRQIVIYLARKYTDQSLQAIGKSVNRYHATALHAINAVERGIKEDGPMQQQVEFLSRKLESGKF